MRPQACKLKTTCLERQTQDLSCNLHEEEAHYWRFSIYKAGKTYFGRYQLNLRAPATMTHAHQVLPEIQSSVTESRYSIGGQADLVITRPSMSSNAELCTIGLTMLRPLFG